MCKAIEEVYEEGVKKGEKRGEKRGIIMGEEKRSIEIARDMLQIEKMPPEKVAMLTRLPLERVLALC